MNKFILTDQSIIYDEHTLYRIRALKDIPLFSVKAGDLGGYVESENNLSQDGDAWVYGNAEVYDNARVSGDAVVYDNARVSGNAWVSDDARVYGNAEVSGDVRVFENARVYGNALVSGNARVYGNAWVYGNARVYGNAWVYGNALVYGNARVSGNARVYGDALLRGHAEVCGNAYVSGDARIQSPISKTSEYLMFHLAGYYVTMTKDLIVSGCQAKTYKEWMNADLSEYGVSDQKEVKRTLQFYRKAFRFHNKHLFKKV